MGYRRVRQVTNWVLVPDDVRSEVLLKTKVGETQSEGEVEGVVYNVSSTSEAYRLEKHAQAEYGIGSYTTVNVQIEVLAQGNRRARKIEGRTIIYTGGSNYLGKDIKPSTGASGDYATKIQNAKQLARKPLPIKAKPQPQPCTMETARPPLLSPSLNFTSAMQHPAPMDVARPLPRSPSLNLASVVPRPASYRGASISGTQAMLSDRGVSLDSTSDDILRDLNEQITRVYEDWKRGLRHTSSRPSTSLKEVSTPTEKDLGDRKRGEKVCEPTRLFPHVMDSLQSKRQTYDSTYKQTSPQASFSRMEDTHTKTSPKIGHGRTTHGGKNRVLPALPEHGACVVEKEGTVDN